MTETTAPPESGRLIDVLRNRAFLRLWLVQAFSQTGQNMAHYALLILVTNIVQQHHIDQASTAVSLSVLSFSLPGIFFSPVAGALVERANKRTALSLTNIARGAAVAGFLFVNPGWRPLLALAFLYVITFVSGTVGQFFGPSIGATIPLLVREREIVQANALVNLTQTGAQIAGFAAVGPLLIKLVGIQDILVAILVIFALCALLSLTIPSTPPAPRAEDGRVNPYRRMVSDIREGIVFILQTPILFKAITYLALATATTLMVAVLAPEYVTGVFKLSSSDIAFLVAPAGIGVFAGAVFVGRITHYIGSERTIDAGMAIGGVSLVLLALIQPIGRALFDARAQASGLVVLAAGFAAVLGVANALVLAPSQALLQSNSPEYMRARVYATFFTVSNGVAFIPIIFAGALADLFGVIKIMFALGALLAVAGFTQLLLKLRRVVS